MTQMTRIFVGFRLAQPNLQIFISLLKFGQFLSGSGAVSTAFCMFSSRYSHKRNLEKNKRRYSYAQPRRGEMSIETLSAARLSPVGAACLLSKDCPNFSISL